MNELQTDEKTAIQTALESIRAHDHHPSARSSYPADRSRSRQSAAKPLPSRSPESFQVAVKPFPAPGSESLQTKMPKLPPDLQTVIQTALQNGFPGQINPPHQPLRQPPANPAAKPSGAATRDPLEELEAQANRINRISRDREATLRRAQSIATQIAQTQIAQERRATRRPVELSLPLEPSTRSQAERPDLSSSRSPLPRESATLRIQVPPDAQATAAEVAQLLRQIQDHRDPRNDASQQTVPARRSRKRPSPVRRLRRWLFASSSDRSSRRYSLNFPDSGLQSPSEAIPQGCGHRCPVAPTEPVFTLQETLTLLVGAALTRLLLNLLLEVLPLLTVPVMIVLILPAAIALYKATIAPQSGILWGYRICVILFGLLIGGRL